ncbi:hypothetical protein V1509DRAFT_625628 [Lipomyces kononenkoae]
MGLTDYFLSAPRQSKPSSTKPNYKEIIGDQDLIAFYEANTPSLRRNAVLESSVNIGLTKETAEELVSRRNFSLHPISREQRQPYIQKASEANCAEFQKVIHDCSQLPVNWRDGQMLEDIKSKEDLCRRAKERHNTCLKTQVRLLYGLGYKLSIGNSTLDTDIRRHANETYISYYGTATNPREPTQSELAKIPE